MCSDRYGMFDLIWFLTRHVQQLLIFFDGGKNSADPDSWYSAASRRSVFSLKCAIKHFGYWVLLEPGGRWRSAQRPPHPPARFRGEPVRERENRGTEGTPTFHTDCSATDCWSIVLIVFSLIVCRPYLAAVLLSVGLYYRPIFYTLENPLETWHSVGLHSSDGTITSTF